MNRKFHVNDLVGEYRVTSFLGEGGMGEVYLGVHEKLGRPAAIKILGAGTSDASFKTRFFNEARLQASLHHPNIATLYDFQEQGDQLLIFMEYVDGESLEDLVSRRSFTVDEALQVFLTICEAVGFIHQNGIVHRDIKSQNIKLSASGSVKLLDFGIAKDAASHGLTQTGGVIGTPNYLSPEQLNGEAATPQADVWALGVLLYEMLTGTLPFKGDTLAGLVLQITTAQFTAPEKINPAVPREAANVVRKCLKKDPHSRFQNVEELKAAVRSVLARKNEKTLSSGATLKQTFGFRSAGEPALVATAIVTGDTSSPNNVDARPNVSNRSPMILIAGGVAAVLLVLIALVGFGIWAINGKAEVSGPAHPQNNVNSNLAQAATLKSGSHRIRVDIDEGRAQVLLKGQVLGVTPLDIDLAAGENPSLTLRRDGYEDKTVQIEVGSGKKVFTFSLKPQR